MSRRSVRVIYNADGREEYLAPGGETVILEDTSKTAEEVSGALRLKGFRVTTAGLKPERGPSLDGFVKDLMEAKEDIVFNLCEGALGVSTFEMHMAALLELHGLKFTGSGPLALGLSLDKGLSKAVLNSRDIMTPEYSVFREPPARLKKGLKFPLILKPLREDASLGIDSGAVVYTMRDLRKRVEYIIEKFSQPAIAEEYIDGREFNVAIIGNGRDIRALPPSEIVFMDFPEGTPRIISYEAKWVAESPLYKKTVPLCPAEIPGYLKDELHSVALKSFEIMGCRDYARVDMRLGEDGNLRVLEVNPNPDISSDAGLARAAGAAGLDYPSLISEIVSIAAKRYSAAGTSPAAMAFY